MEHLADGTVAQVIGRIGLSATNPTGLACSKGCSFCCILLGDDGVPNGKRSYNALFGTYTFCEPTRWTAGTQKLSFIIQKRLNAERMKRGRDLSVLYFYWLGSMQKVSNGETADGPGTLALTTHISRRLELAGQFLKDTNVFLLLCFDFFGSNSRLYIGGGTV